MKTFGHLKLSTRVITHRDQHGREFAKHVTLLSRHCDYEEVGEVVAEFMLLNPQLNKNYVESRFDVRVCEIITYGD